MRWEREEGEGRESRGEPEEDARGKENALQAARADMKANQWIEFDEILIIKENGR